MKKILAILLAVMLVFAFVACGSEDASGDATPTPDGMPIVDGNGDTSTPKGEQGTESPTPDATADGGTNATPTATPDANATPNAAATPTAKPTATAKPTPAPRPIGETLNDVSYLSQYLVTNYQNTSELTPDQIIPFFLTDINAKEGYEWGEKIPAEKFYSYARKCFVMDDKMINTFKASKHYDAATDSYILSGEFYSNSVHNTYVNAYETLGNDEYIIYIKYGAWDSNPDSAGFYDFSFWKARVKYNAEEKNSGFRLLYYSFEKVESVPASATSTNINWY